MAEDRLDIVIFGATGFTGRRVIKEAAHLSKIKHFTWGVAGRCREVLESIVKEAGNIPVIVADLKDEESLKKMAEHAKVVVNCCGPYRFYGEAVVKACIAAKTHHVDISGEPQYMERMQLEYNQAAKEASVYVISACGFDSIPCDFGVIFTQNKFEGEVNSIESYLKVWNTSNVGGAAVNYGTWESAIYGLAHANELREIRTKLFPEKLPMSEPKLPSRRVIHQNPISKGWSTVFPGSDRSVAIRSQRILYEKEKKKPAQIQTYITFESIFQVLLVAIIGGVFSLLTKFELGRSLLLKYPKFFSGGMASREGPSEEAMKNSHFSITFKAEGWTEKLAEPTDKHKDPPNKELITKVSGIDLGYGLTSTLVLLSAIMILREADKMPDNGGVFPPGAAFAKTSMIEELNKGDLIFEVVSSIEK